MLCLPSQASVVLSISVSTKVYDSGQLSQMSSGKSALLPHVAQLEVGEQGATRAFVERVMYFSENLNVL